MTQFGPSCWKDGLTFDARILRYTEKFVDGSETATLLGLIAPKDA